MPPQSHTLHTVHLRHYCIPRVIYLFIYFIFHLFIYFCHTPRKEDKCTSSVRLWRMEDKVLKRRTVLRKGGRLATLLGTCLTLRLAPVGNLGSVLTPQFGLRPHLVKPIGSLRSLILLQRNISYNHAES